MLSARVREQLRGTLDYWGKMPGVNASLRAFGGWRAGFAVSLVAYLAVKLIGVVVHLPPAVDLAALPVGVCALGLALSDRRVKAAEEEREQTGLALWPGLLAGALLIMFTAVYLAVNTVPVSTSQDESAIVLGGHALATRGVLHPTSPLNDAYQTNIIGALHVTYRTATEMYYRTFPGTAALYAPFSVLPEGVGYRLFTLTFGTIAIGALYLIAWKLLRSWTGGLAAALVFAVSPAFGHWAVTVYNNMPVLALELSAFAVIVWAPRERTWLFGVAGLLMSAAFFARITEAVYVAPALVLVLWRTRALRPLIAFGGAGLAGVALVAVTNQIFYGDALFLPQVGQGFIPLPTALQQPITRPTQDLLRRYADYSTGGGTPDSAAGWLQRLDHEWFHVRYLASSTFAFPFLALAFTGLAWRVAARKRDTWQLIALLVMVTTAVLVIYGQKSQNYYGYGQPVVRSAFIRYALPVYALLGVAAGAFLLDATRALRGAAIGWVIPAALLGVVATVGIGHSYDAGVYGFNRLNALRESDRSSWGQIEAFLDQSEAKPLVIGGPSVEKLVDIKYENYFINYDTIPPFLRMPQIRAVVEQAAQERHVYVVTSKSNAADKQLLVYLYSVYAPKKAFSTGTFNVTLWRTGPANYVLFGVDVWNTYGAFDRWTVTDAGHLLPVGENNYVQALGGVDHDGDGRVDRDVTLQFEFLDNGPEEATISGLDPRVSWPPVVLWSSKLDQTGLWRKATVVLKKGEYLEQQLLVSKGLTLKSITLVALGPE